MSMSSSSVVVIGIGAMGGGMARALLEAPAAAGVVGYDKHAPFVEAFARESASKGKSSGVFPGSLKEAVGLAAAAAVPGAPVLAVLSLVNESQCEQVCFAEGGLIELMPKGSCVVLTSTVTAAWAQNAADRFGPAGVHFVDCPVSGGPARAGQGDLTLMASGTPEALGVAMPILESLAREGDLYVVEGGAGKGSTVKCVHQLLAGVHICAAAEAMAMAAKAGIDVEQLYRLVNGAAGASWMFTDRGKRMLEPSPEVKSALAIFVKDLDIVYAEAKRLQTPIPLATAALQQYISGQSLGLSRTDDSQVVKVYENVTQTPVATAASPSPKQEKKKTLVVSNDRVKVFQSDGAEEGAEDLFSQEDVGGKTIVSLSLSSTVLELEFSGSPAASLTKPPQPENQHHRLLWESDRCRVHGLSLPAGETVEASYPFFRLVVSPAKGSAKLGLLSPSGGVLAEWNEAYPAGGVAWKEPTGALRITADGEVALELYIVELL